METSRKRVQAQNVFSRQQVLVVFLLLLSPGTYAFQSRSIWNSGPFQLPSQVGQKFSKAPRKKLRLFESLRPNESGEKMETKASIKVSTLSSYSGFLVLLTVPLAWGTYVPVVRFLYQIDPPVPGLVFSACYYAVASITMLSLAQLNDSLNVADNEMATKSSPASTPPFPIQGGLELGSYLFIANCLQVIGLETVPSDRAGFLVQLTTVFVPIAEAFFAGNLFAVPTKTWSACVLALLGISIMGLDGKLEISPSFLEVDSDSLPALLSTALSSFTNGDLLILAAALLYTLHVVRLSEYARRTTPIRLAAAKATTEAILSISLVGGLYTAAGFSASIGTINSDLSKFVITASSDIVNFWSSFTSGLDSGTIPLSALLTALGAVLWTGWVTCAYTIYAQSFGQSRVSPTNANLIYSVQPLFTAFFAWVLLGETMGPSGFLGGGIIGAAVYLVVWNDGLDLSPSLDEDNEKNGEIDDGEHDMAEKEVISEEEGS